MGKYVWPCPNYVRVSQSFGIRHSGIDLACSKGKPILATRPGTVTRAVSLTTSYGKHIYIDHGGGIISIYAHCSQLLVKAGQKVAAGQVIAYVGSTGNSTGPHLHFEIRVNGVAKNPLNYVSAKDTKAKYTGPGSTSSSSGSSSASSKSSSSGFSTKTEPAKKDITSIVVKSITGSAGTYKYAGLKAAPSVLSAGCEILIQNDKVYLPVIEGDITLEYERKGSPGVLKFNVVKDDIINFQEGNPVRFRVNGNNVFYGYVFEKSRADNHVVSVTCYDQLRYLKNKDTIIYANKTYAQVLRTIAGDYGLTCGTVEDTGYVIANRIEEGTLLDILGNASDLTVLNTGKLFVLYDDFGALCLKNISSMQLPVLIDHDTASDFKYTSTIDQDTYNRIKLALDNDATGQRELYVANDANNQSSWGVLQYYDNISDTTATVLKERANVLLNYYNKKQRMLKINGCFGDVRVRGGSSLVVNLNLGDLAVQNYMVVERVKHTFSHGSHLMDLTVIGVRGEFIA